MRIAILNEAMYLVVVGAWYLGFDVGRGWDATEPAGWTLALALFVVFNLVGLLLYLGRRIWNALKTEEEV